MSNFDFLQAEWRSLYDNIKIAESRIKTEPVSAAFFGRKVLEESIHELYQLNYLEFPYNQDLANLMAQEEIKNIIPQEHLAGLHIVRKTGNNAAHFGNRIKSSDALISIKYLFGFLKWFAAAYSGAVPDLPEHFDESIVPKVGGQRPIKQIQAENDSEIALLKKQLEMLLEERNKALENAQENEEKYLAYLADIAAKQKAVETTKQQRISTNSIQRKTASEYNESETRQHLIDIALKEAGWYDLKEGYNLEFQVEGMPITSDNPRGKGYADYVLWNDNGLPLAVIEAKRTMADIEAGRHQVNLYANCLEQMYGLRPIIFYTNGYEIKLLDDTFYNTPRQIYGFYTKEELQWMIERRQTRQDIRLAKVNTEIAGRPYQIEAIQRVAEAFVITGQGGFLKGDKRNCLLVMATGSGKTRTAAALVELLFKSKWIKRVLFLADRNALVQQAKDNFNSYLPDYTSVNLTKEKEGDTTRLVFSTYQTMMNSIDSCKNEQKEGRFYGVGHFDLIIIDEAHRSIYNRYQAIFEYFDALLVGLTATPKDSIDHNTYELFGCSNEDPTFAFELDKAVPTYLNPYRTISVTTKFLRDGIKYKDLSPAEKLKYEASFLQSKTGLFPEEIHASALNKWLFNKDTVIKVLDALMEHGLKIEGGDKIGRTIIFAANQQHANFIVECFNERYPNMPSGFIATIHNKVSHADSLIKAFCHETKELLPQIAVSVDMMDTGIDAIRVLNLVFFKIVRSYAKFWQMLGRGTRLCADVFGPGQPKEYFLVFDVCQNFEFFELNKKGIENKIQKPITQQIFEARVQLSALLAATGETENINLANELLDILHNHIKQLDFKRFEVQMQKRYVDEFSQRTRWNHLNDDDIHTIEKHLSGLPKPEGTDELARRFDLMMLKLQIAALLMLPAQAIYEDNLMAISDQLSKKYTVPQILQSKALIESMKDPDFYKNLNQKRLDEIRVEIRKLVSYLDKNAQKPIYTNLEDTDITIQHALEPSLGGHGLTMYKNRVERFIRENKHHVLISKLSTNKPISEEEIKELERLLFDGAERGTKDDFVKEYGEKPLGAFIRSIVGLDIETANQAFASFLQVGNLRADQMTFITNIINYLTKNGTIDKKMLFESPFTDVHDGGLTGVFDDADAMSIIRIIKEINYNAGVA